MQPNHPTPPVTSLPAEPLRQGARLQRRGKAMRQPRTRKPAPSPLYVFVVVSLAAFLVGLTFFCQPDVRHFVAGDLRLLGSSPVAYATAPVSTAPATMDAAAPAGSANAKPSASRVSGSNSYAVQQLRQLIGDPRVWQDVLDEFQLTADQVQRPRLKFADISEQDLKTEPQLTVSLDGSRPELAVRLVNRYLQELVERFEKTAGGPVQPAAMLAAEEQVKEARAERDRCQDELEKLLARLASNATETTEPQRDALEAGPALALTPPTPEESDSDESGSPAAEKPLTSTTAAGATADPESSHAEGSDNELSGGESSEGESSDTQLSAVEPSAAGPILADAEQAGDAESTASGSAAETDANHEDAAETDTAEIDAAAERRHLEAQLAEAERSLDAAVDLQRELRERKREAGDVHLAVARAGRPVGRMAQPIPPRQLLWIMAPSILLGAAVAWAARRGQASATLVSVDQVEALSPYPVIPYAAPRVRSDQPSAPEPHVPVARPAKLVRPVVHAGEGAVTLVAALLIGYGATAEGFLQRLLADPLAAYAEAAAMTLHQLL